MSEKLKKGDERIEITIITKQDDFAEVTIDRLHDDVEVTPEDMRLAKRAFRHAYRDYVKARGKEVEEDKKEMVKKEKDEVAKLSPHHQMLKEAIAQGCLVELSLLEGSMGVIVGYEPFTHRNGKIEDFHPERFRINGKDVKLGEEVVVEKTVLSPTPPQKVSVDIPAVVKDESVALEEDNMKSDKGEESTARQEASVLESDMSYEKGKGGEYDG